MSILIINLNRKLNNCRVKDKFSLPLKQFYFSPFTNISKKTPPREGGGESASDLCTLRFSLPKSVSIVFVMLKLQIYLFF